MAEVCYNKELDKTFDAHNWMSASPMAEGEVCCFCGMQRAYCQYHNSPPLVGHKHDPIDWTKDQTGVLAFICPACGELYATRGKTLAEQGWEYAQKLSDEVKEREAKKMEEDLFGTLTGENFKTMFKAWRGNWNTDDIPTDLHVKTVLGYRLDNWDNDEGGGPGVILYAVFETPGGKDYTVQFVIQKDELIKALALMVER